MPSVYHTSNPTEFTQLDGVIVSELSPTPGVVSAGANTAVLLGTFERGPKNDPQRISSISELLEKFGNNPLYNGQKALRLKRWSNLFVTRVVASDAVKATITQSSGANDLATFTAKYEGVYGNKIVVIVSDGTQDATKKVQFQDGDYIETYDNLSFIGKTDAELKEIFKSSTLVDVTGAHAVEEIVNTAGNHLVLAGGSDGNVSSDDYKNALDNSNITASGKLYFADSQSAAVNSVLSNYIKTERSGMCVIGLEDLEGSVDDAIADSDANLDREGRVLYVYNPVKFNIDGVIEEENPVFLAASVINQLPPQVSPAAARSTEFTQTATGVKFNLLRGNLIKLKDAGIMSFEDDRDLGVKIVSAVTGNPEFSVVRRRMSDFIIDSLTSFLKNFQNEPNTLVLRSSIRAAMQNFDDQLVFQKLLPSDEEIGGGEKAVLIKVEGTTTPQERAQGILKIVYKRKLYAEARYIVLETTISETVSISEGEE